MMSNDRGEGEPGALTADGTAPADVRLQAWRTMRDLTTAILGVLDAVLERLVSISVREYQALLLLAAAPPMGIRMADLAERIVLSRSAITALADRMERDELIVRTPDLVDRRGTLVSLTESGRRRFTAAMAVHDEMIADLFASRVSQAEASLLLPVLTRIAEGARAARPSAGNS